MKWWQRRGGHIDLSVYPAPASEKKSSAVSEIESGVSPQNRLDVQTERGTDGLEPASIDGTG